MGIFDGVAKFFGGGAPPPYQTPQNIQNFMQPITQNEMQKVGLYDNLVNAKLGYDNANKNIEGWGQKLADPALTDEQRQKINQNIQAWGRERDAHAQTANQLRDAATALGVDIADYGSDKTSQQSAQALANYKNIAVQNFLNNMPTLGELEKNRYRELRSRGASPSRADSIIAEERGEMNSLLARRLGDFMTTYGTHPDGSINQDLGIAAMTRVLPDPQSVAQLFAQGFAMPNKVYDANRSLNQALSLADISRQTALDTTRMNNQGADYRARLGSDTNILISREGQAGQNERLGTTLKERREENKLNRETQLQIAGLNAAMKLYGSRGGGDGDKLDAEIAALARQLGFKDDLPDEEKQKIWGNAASIVLEHKYGIGNKTLRDVGYLKETMDILGVPKDDQEIILKKKLGWEEPKPTKKDEAIDDAGNNFKNTFNDIQELILAGDKEQATEQLKTLKEKLYSDEYRNLLDEKSYTKAKRKVDVYTKWLRGDYESNEGKRNYVKDRFLAEYGIEPTSDDIQSAFINETFFGMPMRPKVTTPAWKFNVAPMSAGSMYNLGAAYSNPNSSNSNPAYVPYGQAAYSPNR